MTTTKDLLNFMCNGVASAISQHMYTSTTTQGIWVRNFQTCPKMYLVENAKKFIWKFSEFSKLGGITYKFYCHNPSSNALFDFGCLIEPQRGKVNVEEWPIQTMGMWKVNMFDFTNYAGGSKRCLQFELLSGRSVEKIGTDPTLQLFWPTPERF